MAGFSNVPVSETVHFYINTHNTLGKATQADSAPVWVVYEEDTDAFISSGVFVQNATATFRYKASAVISTGSGFEVGKYYNVFAQGTVDSTNASEHVLVFRAASAEDQVGFPKVDVQFLKGTLIAGSAGTAFTNIVSFTMGLTEPAGVPAWDGTGASAINWALALQRNKMVQTTDTSTLRNDADDANIATSVVSDDGGSFVRGEWA